MRIGVNAIATLLDVNEKGELDLNVKDSKNMQVGRITIELGKEELPGYNDII